MTSVRNLLNTSSSWSIIPIRKFKNSIDDEQRTLSSKYKDLFWVAINLFGNSKHTNTSRWLKKVLHIWINLHLLLNLYHYKKYCFQNYVLHYTPMTSRLSVVTTNKNWKSSVQRLRMVLTPHLNVLPTMNPQTVQNQIDIATKEDGHYPHHSVFQVSPLLLLYSISVFSLTVQVIA